MELTPEEIRQAIEWLTPMGVGCTEAQADGVPCTELDRDCTTCQRAEPVRRLLLKLAAAQAEPDTH